MRKKEKLQDRLKNTIKRKAAELNATFKENQQRQWENTLQENYVQLQKIQRLNYRAAILLCSGEKIRNLLISSLFLDVLLFLIPPGSNFLLPQHSEILVQVCSYGLLWFGAVIILTPYFTNLISNTRRKLRDPGLLALAVVFLGITMVFILQLLDIGKNKPPSHLMLEGIFSLLALGTLYQGLKKVYQSPWRPQINHLLRAVYFFGSLGAIRLIALIFSLLTALSNIDLFQWILFELTVLILIINIDLPAIYSKVRR